MTATAIASRSAGSAVPLTRPRTLTVLTFHRIVETRGRDHDISWRSFVTFLDELVAAELTFATDLDCLTQDESAVVLTFDDATIDHLRVGLELSHRNLHGIFFVPTAKIATDGYMDVAGVRRLTAQGHVIGSHSHRHAPLAGLSADELGSELRASRDRIVEIVGVQPRYFAPPGGIGSVHLASELQQLGFTRSRSMRWGIHNSTSEAWNVPCIPVTELTLARGWVRHAVLAHRLPTAMRAAWLVKELLPNRMSIALRGASHGAWEHP